MLLTFRVEGKSVKSVLCLEELICLHGLPPKCKKGSRTTHDGYWMRLSREFSRRSKPFPAFIKEYTVIGIGFTGCTISSYKQLVPDDDQVTNCYIL